MLELPDICFVDKIPELPYNMVLKCSDRRESVCKAVVMLHGLLTILCLQNVLSPYLQSIGLYLIILLAILIIVSHEPSEILFLHLIQELTRKRLF